MPLPNLPYHWLELAGPLCGPPFNNEFFLGIEFHRVASLRVHIAKEAFFPAGEGEECHRRGHTDIDADVACLRLVAELACRRAAAGEERCHVPKGSGVDQSNRHIDGLRVYEAQYRSEDLRASDLAPWINLIEDSRAHEVATLVAGNRRAASIDKNLRALARPLSDQHVDTLPALRGNHRSHLDVLLEAVADAARLRVVNDAFGEARARLADGDGDRCRQAALTGTAEGRVGDDTRRHLHVGVGQDDRCVLRASLALRALAIGRCAAVHVARDGR